MATEFEYLSSIPVNNNKTKSSPEVKNDRPKINQVVECASAKKPSAASTFARSFIKEDAGTIGNYILNDVIAPAVKTIISEVVTNSINLLLFGDTRNASGNKFYKSSIDGRSSFTIYHNDGQKKVSNNGRSTTEIRKEFDLSDFVFDTKVKALKVRDSMIDILESYPNVSVSEAYALCGLPASGTLNHWGWNKLGSAEVRLMPNGQWYIDLPDPIYID